MRGQPLTSYASVGRLRHAPRNCVLVTEGMGGSTYRLKRALIYRHRVLASGLSDPVSLAGDPPGAGADDVPAIVGIKIPTEAGQQAQSAELQFPA